MDLRFGCCDGELSWAENSVLGIAPKNVPIIVTVQLSGPPI